MFWNLILWNFKKMLWTFFSAWRWTTCNASYFARCRLPLHVNRLCWVLWRNSWGSFTIRIKYCYIETSVIFLPSNLELLLDCYICCPFGSSTACRNRQLFLIFFRFSHSNDYITHRNLGIAIAAYALHEPLHKALIEQLSVVICALYSLDNY